MNRRTGLVASVIVPILAAAIGLWSAGVAAAQPAPASLAVPGGVPALARAIGLNERTPRARVMLAAIRVLHDRIEGADRAADARRAAALAYVKGLTTAPPSEPSGAADSVPLPLPASVWTALSDVSPDLKGSVLAIVLGDRRAALAYYGLSAMDDRTRAYLAAHDEARAVVFDKKRAPVLALYGRSLRIRDDRIDVPGGAAAVSVWEQLASASVTDPAAFIGQVLGRDGGRLALFYDTLAHLDGVRLAFALGGGTAPRGDLVQALYEASAVALAGWDPVERPFVRVAYDAAQLLFTVHLTADGRLAGPAVRGLWTAAFERQGLPDDPAADVKSVRAGERLDAAGLIGLVGVANARVRRERAEAWLIAQRAFARATDAEWPDILVTVRAYPLFPALIVTLDRIGITHPATYAAAIRRANRVTRAFDRQKSTTAVALFQGALALVERARFSRAIDAARADALIASLSAVPVSEEGEYLGGVAAWIERDYLEAVGEARRSEAARATLPLEDRVLAAIAGATVNRRAVTGPAPVIEWEGLTYRVDQAAADLARFVAIRSRQAATPLDPALALARLAPTVRAATSKADAEACLTAAEAAAASAGKIPGTPGPAAADLQTDRLLERIRSGVRALTDPPNPNPLIRIAKLVRQASDAYLAQALLSLAYAPHLGDVETAALLGGDPAWRHSFGLEESRAGQAALIPWRLAEETRGRAQGWYLVGSILDLDLSLGRLSLKRVATDRLPDPPAMRDTDRQALTEAVVLMNPADQSDAARDDLAAALARGRARIAALGDEVSGLRDLVAAAGLDEWRAEALAWALACDRPSVPGFFSLGDLVRLGSPAAAPAADSPWHAFGTSGWALEAWPALRYPSVSSWATMRWRIGMRLVPAMMPDLALGIVDMLAARHLPATLTRGILAAATQDLLDQLRADHDDDWMTMIAQAQAVVRDRFDDDVASLTSGGPLLPVRKDAPDAR